MISNIKYQFLIVCFPIFVFSVFNNQSNAQSKSDSLLTEYYKVKEDTSKIKILFEIGDLYIDGPSDSLLHYYNKGLIIIHDNLRNLNKDRKNEVKRYLTFRHFEFRALIEFGIEYFFRSDYKLALVYFFSALDIAEELEDISIISECYSEIGIVYKNQGKYDQALEYNDKAIALAEQGVDTSWIAACYANHGTIFLKKGYYTLALDYYIKALKTFEKLDHKRRMGACYLNIGKIYSEQSDYNKALEYFSRVLSISHETGDKVSQTDCYLNIGKVYANMGEYELSRDYTSKALELYEELGYRHEMDECFKIIGTTYKNENNFNKAIEYYNKALEISVMEEDMPGIAEIYGQLANVSYKQKEFTRALEYAIYSSEVADQSGNLNARKNAYQCLSEIYSKTGDLNKALEYYILFSSIKDSLFNENKYKAMRELETKYETQKKENQLALLTEKSEVQMLKISRRNRGLLTSAALILLILIIGYILVRNSRLRARQQTIELEQKLLRSQMNPHFIFNSLIAIQSYIYKKDPVKAGDFLAKFADLVRITLENSRVEFVLFEKEMKMLEVYLALQSIRFENKFTYEIEVDKNIDEDNLRIPPMFAQPFIENAIEHGLRHKPKGGLIKLSFDKNNDHILCTIEDNGVGREKAKEIEKKKQNQSLAIDITKERLDILSKRLKQKFSLEIIDLKNEKDIPRGTKVNITIPFTS